MIDRTALSLLAVAALACTSLAGGVAHAGAPVGSGPVLGDPSTTQNFIAMGQVRLTGLSNAGGDGFEVVEGTSRNAVVNVGVPSAFAGTNANPRAAELNLDNGNTRLDGQADPTVKSGPDCVGQWSTNGNTNSFSWGWSQTTDALTVNIIRSGTGDAAFNCTLRYPGFSAGLLAAHPNWDGTQSLNVATRLTMMNAARLVVVTPSGQSTTVGSLAVDSAAVAPATVGPVAGATVDKQISGYDFDSGGAFTISGTIASTNVLQGCSDTCMLQISIGHLSYPPVDAGGTTSVTGVEGSPVFASGSFTDADGDPLAITSAGPGTVVDNGGGSWSWSWTPGDEATGTVEVNANDGWGNNTIHSFTYDISNAPPSLTSLVASPSPALTGDVVTWTGTATDPGATDELEWKFGDDVFQSANTTTRTYSTCGEQSLTAVVQDDSGSSDSLSASVDVYDATVGPPLSVATQNLVQRGQVVPVKLWIGCDDASLLGLAPAIRLRTTDTLGIPDSAPDTGVPVSVSAADTGGEMRPADGFYLYNLQVPNNPAWPAGKELTVEMYPFGFGNPSVVQVVLKLRR